MEYHFSNIKGVPLDQNKVLSACEKLYELLSDDIYAKILSETGIGYEKAKKQTEEARTLINPDFLKERIKRELSGFPFTHNGTRYDIRPVGTILHIPASNAGAIGAYSVIEGLLTGNRNIIKPSSKDSGITQKLIDMLTDCEPDLKNYIYVANVPSSDKNEIMNLIFTSNAVCVWGGSEAIRSIRELCPSDTDIIEWGHRVSFCYSVKDADEEALYHIAKNICDTDQMYCSSCQQIYVDTDDPDDILSFSERFLRILEKTAENDPHDIFKDTGRTLELKCAEFDGQKVLKGSGCAVIPLNDAFLKSSVYSRCCEIKPLKRENIYDCLCRYKNILQTAALICGKDDEKELSELLFNAGVKRITRPENMDAYSLMHDGEYSLRRYVRITSSDF